MNVRLSTDIAASLEILPLWDPEASAAFDSQDPDYIATRKSRPDFRPDKCRRCGKVYNYRSSMYRHVKYECGKEKLFQCLYCAFRTKRKDLCKRHMYKTHNDSESDPLSCRDSKENE